MFNPEALAGLFETYKPMLLKFLLKYVADNREQIDLKHEEREDSLFLQLDIKRSLFVSDEVYQEIVSVLENLKQSPAEPGDGSNVTAQAEG